MYSKNVKHDGTFLTIHVSANTIIAKTLSVKLYFMIRWIRTQIIIYLFLFFAILIKNLFDVTMDMCAVCVRACVCMQYIVCSIHSIVRIVIYLWCVALLRFDTRNDTCTHILLRMYSFIVNCNEFVVPSSPPATININTAQSLLYSFQIFYVVCVCGFVQHSTITACTHIKSAIVWAFFCFITIEHNAILNNTPSIWLLCWMCIKISNIHRWTKNNN